MTDEFINIKFYRLSKNIIELQTKDILMTNYTKDLKIKTSLCTAK